jgi:hypothetical protein
MRRSWSPAAEDKLRALYATTELPRLAFLLKRSPTAVKSRAGVLGLSKGLRKPWTRKEDATLRRRYPNEPTATVAADLGRTVSTTYQRAATLGLSKSAKYLASPAAGRTNGRQGIGTRFGKGHVPANKGLRRPGWTRGRMADTQFRKGERQGIAVKLWKPIGTERVSKDGYREVKIHDGLPLQSRWRAVHLVEWEKVNGPLPKGHALVFRDGDKANTAPENMELITRADLMRRNTLHRYPQPIPQLIQLRGALNRKINRKDRHA